MQNLSSKDFFKKTTYNFETQNQIWCSQLADAHDNFCCCNHPFAHLLSSIFPPGHTDRDLTITQILTRDYTEICLSGGTEEENHGLADTGGEEIPTEEKPPEEEIEDLEDIEIEELIAAADAATER